MYASGLDAQLIEPLTLALRENASVDVEQYVIENNRTPRRGRRLSGPKGYSTVIRTTDGKVRASRQADTGQ